MVKKLTKSRTDKKWLGVCGGLGKYCECDPTIFRLLAVILSLVGGGGLLFYLIAAIVMPFEELPKAEE